MRHARRTLPPLACVALVLLAAVPRAVPADADAAPRWRWPAAEKVVAIGDVHGALEPLSDLLRAMGLADERLRWTGGRAHLVLLGDLLGHGPREREVLDLVMRLEREASAAGGHVHVVLGEHEVMNLAGDFRRVAAPGFAAFAGDEVPSVRDAALARFTQGRAPAFRATARADFDRDYPRGWFARRAAFGPGGVYGEFLRRAPVLVVIGDTLFVHGGLPPSLAQQGPEDLVRTVARSLAGHAGARAHLVGLGLLDPETPFMDAIAVASERLALAAANLGGEQADAARASLAVLAGTASEAAFRPDGPAWYAGSGMHPEADEVRTFEAALGRAGAVRAVIAHGVTPGARITSRFGGRLVRIGTGMFRPVFRGRPAALVLAPAAEPRTVYPGEAAGSAPATPLAERTSLPSDAERAAEDAALEEFLRTAEVVHSEAIGTGVTKPERVTLRKDGVTRRAAFKTVSKMKAGVVRLGNRVERGFSDRWQHEVAAYRLDRMIGLGMVPVTVERAINGRTGSLQAWVEGAIDEQARLHEGLYPEDPDLLERQLNRLRVFDILIYNVDRNLGNRLFTLADWRLHLIDHSRSFRNESGRPPMLGDIPVTLPADLRPGVAGLDRKRLEAALGEFLTRKQLDALWERRALVLGLAASPAP